MDINEAWSIIESVGGATDKDCPFGEAVEAIRKALMEGQKPSTNSAMVPCGQRNIGMPCQCKIDGLYCGEFPCYFAQHQ